jgi:hypothetical protein
MKLSIVLLFALMVCLALVSISQEKQDKQAAAGQDQVTVKGFILDAMCGDVLAKKKKDVMLKASKHTRMCGLAEACAASGYGIFTEGRWVKFDTKGNTIAKAALEKSTKEKNLLFTVTGQMKDGLFVVAKIAEVEPDGEDETAAPRRD